jgi:hypothetical protein
MPAIGHRNVTVLSRHCASVRIEFVNSRSSWTHDILTQAVHMADVLRSFEPLTLPRPRGAHRYDVFSPKPGRRLTLHRRSAFEARLLARS